MLHLAHLFGMTWPPLITLTANGQLNKGHGKVDSSVPRLIGIQPLTPKRFCAGLLETALIWKKLIRSVSKNLSSIGDRRTAVNKAIEPSRRLRARVNVPEDKSL